jgi:hypothetical protein
MRQDEEHPLECDNLNLFFYKEAQRQKGTGTEFRIIRPSPHSSLCGLVPLNPLFSHCQGSGGGRGSLWRAAPDLLRLFHPEIELCGRC